MYGAALLLAMMVTQTAAPPCWVRGDRAGLSERPSPLDSVMATVGQDTIKVCYSRPSARGREIVGDLVPFGQPWRLGANEATTLHLTGPMMIGDVSIGPGSYTLYVVPDREHWQVVVNEAVERWGVPINEEIRQADVGVAHGMVETLDQPVEMLTLRLQRSGNALDLLIEWERTRVRVPVRPVSS